MEIQTVISKHRVLKRLIKELFFQYIQEHTESLCRKVWLKPITFMTMNGMFLLQIISANFLLVAGHIQSDESGMYFI